VRHCEDYAQLRGRDAQYFAPERAEGVPDVAWAYSEDPRIRIDMAALWAEAETNGGAGPVDGIGRPELCAAVKRIERDKLIEPTITRDVMSSTGKGELAGLAFRVKSPKSMARRIKDKSAGWEDEPGLVQIQVADGLKDTIRYTDKVVSPDDLVGEARTVTSNLAARGYKVVEAESFYADGAPYKGLHTTIEAPDGTRFELQFHSAQSLEVKEGPESAGGTGGIHVFYEYYRDKKNLKDWKGKEVCSACWDECVRQSSAVQTPADMDGLTDLGGCEVTRIAVEKPSWYIEPDEREEYTGNVRDSDLRDEARRLA